MIFVSSFPRFMIELNDFDSKRFPARFWFESKRKKKEKREREKLGKNYEKKKRKREKERKREKMLEMKIFSFEKMRIF